MEYLEGTSEQRSDVISLFRNSFAASEGDAEGQLIAGLVGDIFATSDDHDVAVFVAQSSVSLAGCIIFTRLRFDKDDRTVFLLSPVAVAPTSQGQGVGQGLLTHGLTAMRARGIDVVLTYGDPNFYAKVGFRQISPEEAQPPQKLQYPEGWLAIPLADDAFSPLLGVSQAVPAFDDPVYW